jgi:Domain of unknown function DUF29
VGTFSITDSDYARDLYAWSRRNAELLRQGRLAEIDAEHIAEELEDMGRSERHALASHLKVLISHLLKWQYQKAFRGVSWQLSIDNARDEIEQILSDSPSLRTTLDELVAARYRAARKRAAMETGLSLEGFPEECPFATGQLVAEDYWPE